MQRSLRVLWHESRQELEVRRITGQVFRFTVRQALAGAHQVFAVDTDGRDVYLLTGPKGARRPTRKVRFSDTGMYRGNSGI